jgi:hypothetical protein
MSAGGRQVVPRHQLLALVLLGLLAVGHSADFRVIITKLSLNFNCKLYVLVVVAVVVWSTPP